ncbi:hypothetical protein APR12_003742 [Nocardia amikacinitolerans]|nr:hypothetical protein [Nocardia amikacinitolerans]
MQALEVELGKVPEALPEGAKVRIQKGQPILVVGPTFADHSRAEQDYMVTGILLAMDLVMRRRLLFSYAVSLSLALPLGFASGGAIASGIPAWLVVPASMAVWVTCYVAAHMVRLRRFAYRVDRRMVEEMGRPLMDTMLDFDRRMRDRRPGLLGRLLKLSSASPSQRAKRLDAIPVATIR